MHLNTVLRSYSLNEKESDVCIPDIVVEAPSRNFPHSMGSTEFFHYLFRRDIYRIRSIEKTLLTHKSHLHAFIDRIGQTGRTTVHLLQKKLSVIASLFFLCKIVISA